VLTTEDFCFSEAFKFLEVYTVTIDNFYTEHFVVPLSFLSGYIIAYLAIKVNRFAGKDVVKLSARAALLTYV
jgi:hypothetical protein